jgi:protein-S-isoprenylcysteine O-methyltransferase Ste14
MKALPSLLLEVFYCLLLFLAAGSLIYWNGWLFIGAYYISIFLIMIYLTVNNPALFEKRMKIKEEDNAQKLFKILLAIITVIIRLISGYDYRFHWSTVSIILVVLSTILMILGTIILFNVMKQNTYLSAVIEVQEDQKVMDTGLYSIVRHPMYMAYSIIFLFTPLVLGSFYALIPSVITLILLVMRIINEEKVLIKELKGYDLYVKKVKYRLIPYIW